MRSCTLPRGSIPFGSCFSRYCRRGGPGTGFPMCLAMLAGVLLSLQTVGSGLNPEALVIVTQPASVIDCEDHIVTFKVVISGGTEPVTYIWQRKRPLEPDFSNIPPGAPNITYPFPGTIRIDNVGGFENPGGSRYRVVVTDISGSVTSADALLTVNEITDIIPSVAFPAKTNVILCEGADFSYTVTTAGTPPVAYQWKKYLGPGVWANLTDKGIISGSQSAVLSFAGATPAESGQYKVNITFHSSFSDCQVSSDSRIRLLTIQGDPVAPVIPQPPTACLGLPPGLLTAEAASGGSNNFLYQWKESPDGLTWNNIPGACELSYQPPLATANTWYRLAAVDNGLVSCGNATSGAVFQPVTDCFNLHYRTVQDGLWHDRTTWETSNDGITWGGTAWTWPTSLMLSTHIRPSHLVEVTQDVSVARVTVEAGGALTIAGGATLTNGDPSGASGFKILSSETAHGSLIADGTFSGELTCRKHFDPSRWTIMAAPLKVTGGFEGNAAAIRFDATGKDYDFAWYRELDNDGWSYYPTLPASLDPGKGYVIRTVDTNTPEEGMITFAGTLNGLVNDTVSPAVYCTSPRHGWNGVGNPFTSAIGVIAFASTAENFLTRNAAILEDTYGAVYLWNQTGSYDGSQQYYRAIGNSGYNFEDFSYYGGDDPDYLQSGQGFLINVRENGKVVFSEAMQTHAPGVRLKSGTVGHDESGEVNTMANDCTSGKPNSSRQNSGASWPGLTLVAQHGNRIRRTVVTFHESMTSRLDKTFDAGLLSSDNFRLYTRLVGGDQGADLEIQCLPDGLYGAMEIPVGLDLPEGGEVVFRVQGVILPEGWVPLLDDRVAKISTPLPPGTGEYRVLLPRATSGKGRFYLRFGSSRIVTGSPEPALNNQSRFSISCDGKSVIITGMPGPKATAALIRMDGSRLSVLQLEQVYRQLIPLDGVAAGIYLLEITDNQGSETYKVVVISL